MFGRLGEKPTAGEDKMGKEEEIYDAFLWLVKNKSPEYALGILESMKMAYFGIIINKVKHTVEEYKPKKGGLKNDRKL